MIKLGMMVMVPGGEIGYVRSLLVRDCENRVMAEVVLDDNQKRHAVVFVYPKDLLEVEL
jgi:hypothetical protein